MQNDLKYRFLEYKLSRRTISAAEIKEKKVSKLKAMRLLRKLKLRELAARCGVSTSAIGNSEAKGINTARIAKRYAAVLGCDWKDLMD